MLDLPCRKCIVRGNCIDQLKGNWQHGHYIVWRPCEALLELLDDSLRMHLKGPYRVHTDIFSDSSIMIVMSDIGEVL